MIDDRDLGKFTVSPSTYDMPVAHAVRQREAPSMRAAAPPVAAIRKAGSEQAAQPQALVLNFASLRANELHVKRTGLLMRSCCGTLLTHSETSGRWMSHLQPPSPSRPSTQSWLGFTIMILLVAYHYVTADPKFAEQQKQQ
jgi:hypothetical protein